MQDPRIRRVDVLNDSNRNTIEISMLSLPDVYQYPVGYKYLHVTKMKPVILPFSIRAHGVGSSDILDSIEYDFISKRFFNKDTGKVYNQWMAVERRELYV